MRKIVHNKIFLVAVCVGLVFGLYISARLLYMQWQKKMAIQKEMEALSEQAKELESKNQDLKSTLSYLTSTAYHETVARKDLNLKEDGEIVVSLPKELPKEQKTSADQIGQVIGQSNPEKWWRYFFSK